MCKLIANPANAILTNGIMTLGRTKSGLRITGKPAEKPKLEPNATGNKLIFAMATLVLLFSCVRRISKTTIIAKITLAPPIVPYVLIRELPRNL